jgi:DNA-binding response OmpR family regulator
MVLKSRILVVADEPRTRRYLEVRLHGRGYRTIFADDAQSAVSAMRRELPRLVLVDMSMGGHKGVDVLERLDEGSLVQVPVIALVGAGSSVSSETEPELARAIDEALADAACVAA